MERYYNAGYYLIKARLLDFGEYKGKAVSTCSRCINISVFDHWCFIGTSDKLDEKEKIELDLTDEKINKIQQWTDNKFENSTNVFPELKIANEFKDLFFRNRKDIEIFSLYFSETETQLLIEEFGKGKNTNEFNYNDGNFELRHNLIKRTEEKDDENEEFLGYDFIGVECDGSFHSFYCNDITNSLIEKFSLRLNKFGLFEELYERNNIKEYLNNQETRLEPVPWYLVKVKRIKHTNS
jgi:hypothetical protein